MLVIRRKTEKLQKMKKRMINDGKSSKLCLPSKKAFYPTSLAKNILNKKCLGRFIFVVRLSLGATCGGKQETAAINPGISLLYTEFHATSRWISFAVVQTGLGRIRDLIIQHNMTHYNHFKGDFLCQTKGGNQVFWSILGLHLSWMNFYYPQMRSEKYLLNK